LCFGCAVLWLAQDDYANEVAAKDESDDDDDTLAGISDNDTDITPAYLQTFSMGDPMSSDDGESFEDDHNDNNGEADTEDAASFTDKDE
jgi:hypothetical protein